MYPGNISLNCGFELRAHQNTNRNDILSLARGGPNDRSIVPEQEWSSGEVWHRPTHKRSGETPSTSRPANY